MEMDTLMNKILLLLLSWSVEWLVIANNFNWAGSPIAAKIAIIISNIILTVYVLLKG